MYKLLTFIVITFIAIPANAQDFIVVSQPNAPLEISSYEVEYKERGRYTTEGIHHTVEFNNSSGQQIVASQIGLVSFSIFNEFLDRMGGIDMDSLDPGDDAEGTWVASAYADFSFYTGVAYVSKVRFSDGTIWEADLEAVANSIRDIQEDFDASRLQEDNDETE